VSAAMFYQAEVPVLCQTHLLYGMQRVPGKQWNGANVEREITCSHGALSPCFRIFSKSLTNASTERGDYRPRKITIGQATRLPPQKRFSLRLLLPFAA
jgi:hypothetical protein